MAVAASADVKAHSKIMWQRVFKKVEALNRKHSRVGDSAFFNPESFSWVKDVEAEWQSIRSEMEVACADRPSVPNFQDVSPDQYNLTQDDKWKTYFLYAYGRKVKQNCDACPKTTLALQKIPGMKTAFFSILSAGKKIPLHRGPYNGVLRFHLGLQVPANALLACGIEVNGQPNFWQDGKSLIFDDTYEHQAWNETDEERVVLFVDFLRPLPWWLSLINRLMVFAIGRSEFVQPGLKKLQKKNDQA